jgi:hypothetical protein
LSVGLSFNQGRRQPYTSSLEFVVEQAQTGQNSRESIEPLETAQIIGNPNGDVSVTVCVYF